MTNPYVNFALGIQALRRDVERRRSPLCGALGVRAELFPHQIANVNRILTSEEVRHLLADEVGLGKTVQALMVLNALRLQRADLRVMILVPDRLVSQWRDEILTRAHVAPVEWAPAPDEPRKIRLAWPATVTPAEITAEHYDMLIVDELHELQANLQNRVISEASRFRHLLILTATPNFRAVVRHVQLFAALEPSRTALARFRVADTDEGRAAGLGDEPQLGKWPEWALNQVVEELIARDVEVARLLRGETGEWSMYGGEPPSGDRERAAAIASCVYRRVIRTRRKDYSGLLPERVHRPLVVEPTFGEAERQRLMWAYFKHLGGLSREVDEVKLAKRVILSAPSLRQRVTYLRGHGHEREGVLAKVAPLLSDDSGDARLDTLTDLLSEVWREDPTERVLVAAQDNLTVDYLFRVIPARLPVIGPVTDRVPLVPARVRQGMNIEAVEDLGGFGNETNENLEDFQRGEAQVLFAPEAAQVGLNLQCARILVLYSVPWSPEEVEQLIGRLDRIGNTAVWTSDGGSRPVEVYTIVQRGLVDEKVVAVLQRFRVFERNINLDGEHLQEIADSIQAAALRTQELDWDALEARAEAVADEDSEQELASELRAFLPWGAQHAKGVWKWVNSLPPVNGALYVSSSQTGPHAWDQAVEGWLWLLERANEYQLRLGQRERGRPDSRFCSLWYTYGERLPYRAGKKVLSQVELIESSGVDNPRRDRHPSNAVAFFNRRKDMTQPPRREVHMTIGKEEYARPLHFLNHGDPLHEDLLNGWLERNEQSGAMLGSIEVRLPKDHQAIKTAGEGLYLLRTATVDPADCLPPLGGETVSHAVADAAKLLAPDKLVAVLTPFVERLRASIAADIRWLRGILPAMLQISAFCRQGDRWIPTPDGFVEAILNPYASETGLNPVSRKWSSPDHFEEHILDGFERLEARQADEAKAAWSSRLPALERETEQRAYAVSVNGCDGLATRRIKAEEAERLLAVAAASESKINVIRAEAAYKEATDVAGIVEAATNQRVEWLGKIRALALEPDSVTQAELVIRLRAQQ